jgi:3-methyladenine DNA glycosylase/8-oxoguanine DNA glycosylase
LTVTLAVEPRGPYSLALSARLAGDATRTFHDGVLTAAVVGGNSDEIAQAWQLPNATVCIRAQSDAGAERLRWLLALDDDHSEFIRSIQGDPLLGRAAFELRGLRPVRTGSVAHALLRAFCGQLIEARRARGIERRIVREISPPVADGLHAAPTTRDLAALSPADLRALGLHARRGSALVRLCRSLDLERLHGLPTAAVAARLERERGLGPWSVGIVCLEGLGRFDYGLVGDLGLVKLLRAWRGRRVEGWETAELLAPYGRFAGIASVYLLTALGRGIVPSTEPLRQAA